MAMVWSDAVGHWDGPAKFVFDVPWPTGDGQVLTTIDFRHADLGPNMTPLMALEGFLNPDALAAADGDVDGPAPRADEDVADPAAGHSGSAGRSAGWAGTGWIDTGWTAADGFGDGHRGDPDAFGPDAEPRAA